MAVDAGSVKYEIDVETKALLKAEKIIATSINKQVDAIRALEKELTSASQKISKTGVVTNAFGQVNKVATKKLSGLREEMRRANKEMDRTGQEALEAANKLEKLEKETAATSRAFDIQAASAIRARKRTIAFGQTSGRTTKQIANMSRASGQAGIQMQQFIGQIQGGQSPMLAFSQQSADLGFVLGFPLLGAISGIAASITGLMLPSLLNGETAVGRLQKVMESLRETAITTDQGITLLSSGIEKLAKRSKAAAAIEIELAIKKANAAIIDARESIRDAAEEWAGFGQGTSLLNQQFGLAERASKRLGKTINDLVTGEGIDQTGGGFISGLFDVKEAFGLRDAVASTAKEFRISKKSALEYLETLNDFKNGKATFEDFAEIIVEISKDNSNTTKSFVELAEVTAKATSSAAEAADILTVLQAASIDLDETLKTTSEGGFKKQEQAAKDLSDALDQMFAAEERADKARERREATGRARISAGVKTLGLTPLDALKTQQKSQLDLLRAGLEQEEFAKKEFDTRKLELERQHQEQIAALQKKTAQDGILNFEALETQAIGSFVQVISGAKSSKEAMSDLANVILNQAIAGLIKMGIETIKNRILGEALEKSKQAGIAATTAAGITATAASTATTVAAAGTVATAAAVPAALTSTFSFGGAALIGGAALLGTLALIKGAREHGGPVSAGGSFLVGERGPEIFTPVSGGNITSNKDSFGGTVLNVTVENNTSSVVSTQLSDDGSQLRVVINEVANQINSNQGVIPQALKNSTNVTFRSR